MIKVGNRIKCRQSISNEKIRICRSISKYFNMPGLFAIITSDCDASTDIRFKIYDLSNRFGLECHLFGGHSGGWLLIACQPSRITLALSNKSCNMPIIWRYSSMYHTFVWKDGFGIVHHYR